MAAYSQDLRQRVIDCIDRKEGSLRQIAQRFVVSLSFVVRLLQLHRRTGSLDPKPSVWVLPFNPFFALIEVVRAPMLGYLPSAMTWIMAVVYSIMLLGFSWWLLVRARGRVPFWL